MLGPLLQGQTKLVLSHICTENMDDIVVKTKDKATLIQDLEETFDNLCKINLKLNPSI